MDTLLVLLYDDWQSLMDAVGYWLRGESPYGRLVGEIQIIFAYPPLALGWMALLFPLGLFGFFLWTGLEISLWAGLAWKEARSQFLLLLWPPLIHHLLLGQVNLAIILVQWAAYRAKRLSWLWGIALAWTLFKPQVAILPLLWLLWRERNSALRWRLWAGLILGVILFALPPTLKDPKIWLEWVENFHLYRIRVLQMAPWQGWGLPILALAAFLWYKSRRGGWQWWLTAALMPATSPYALVALLPALRPRQSYWTLAGLALAAVLQGPVTEVTLPIILAGQLLAAWMISGGPAPG